MTTQDGVEYDHNVEIRKGIKYEKFMRKDNQKCCIHYTIQENTFSIIISSFSCGDGLGRILLRALLIFIKENNINIDDTTSVILTPEPYIIESVLFKGIRNEEKLINYYKKIGFEFPPDEQIHMIGTIGNIINKINDYLKKGGFNGKNKSRKGKNKSRKGKNKSRKGKNKSRKGKTN